MILTIECTLFVREERSNFCVSSLFACKIQRGTKKDWTGTNSWISLFLFWSEWKNFHTTNNVCFLRVFYTKTENERDSVSLICERIEKERIFFVALCAVFVKNRISHYIYRKNCTKDNKPFSDKAHNLINDSRGAPFLFLRFVLFARQLLSIHFHRMFLSPLNSFRTQLCQCKVK